MRLAEIAHSRTGDQGGVTRSLALDAHGKSLSSAILSLEVPASERA